MNEIQRFEKARNIKAAIVGTRIGKMTSYATFAGQIAALIGDGKIKNGADILKYTSFLYPRDAMTSQWINFHKAIKKSGISQCDSDDLRYIFSYLKRMFTIEAKNPSSKKTTNEQPKPEIPKKVERVEIEKPRRKRPSRGKRALKKKNRE